MSDFNQIALVTHSTLFVIPLLDMGRFYAYLGYKPEIRQKVYNSQKCSVFKFLLQKPIEKNSEST